MKHIIHQGRLAMSSPSWLLIQQVQREGNKLLWATESVEAWEFPEDLGAKVVKSDGIALWKMRELGRLGIPTTCLTLAIFETEAGQATAGVIVGTTQGEFVLDCRFSPVKAMDELTTHGYRCRYRGSGPGMLERVKD